MPLDMDELKVEFSNDYEVSIAKLRKSVIVFIVSAFFIIIFGIVCLNKGYSYYSISPLCIVTFIAFCSLICCYFKSRSAYNSMIKFAGMQY